MCRWTFTTSIIVAIGRATTTLIERTHQSITTPVSVGIAGVLDDQGVHTLIYLNTDGGAEQAVTLHVVFARRSTRVDQHTGLAIPAVWVGKITSNRV